MYLLLFQKKLIMAKKETLTSDLDFIREFEELKIKQRLLIENLKKKGQLDQDKLFLEINAKLDFLVKIFKEANSAENQDAKNNLEDKNKEQTPNEVLVKVEELSKKIDDKFKGIEDQLLQLQKKVNNINNNPIPQTPVIESAPKPDFSAKIDNLTDSTKDKKSKKWF